MSALAIRIGDRTVAVTVGADGRVTVDDASFMVVRVGAGLYTVSNGVRRWRVAVAGPVTNRWIHVDGRVERVEVEAGGGGRVRARAASHDLLAPMPATVMRVLAEAGQAVKRGDTLIVLEAMKMELPVRAPRDGIVKAVHCSAGELVQPGINLLDLE